MNLSIQKEKLSRLLYLTNTIVERKNTMPVLGNVKLSAENGVLSVAATDLEVSLLGNTPAEVKSPGAITVSGRVLYEIVRELPAEDVIIRLAKGQRLEIESGASKFKINGISPEEFPSVMGITLKKPVAVEAGKLCEMIDRTAYAVSLDETRYNITGVCVEMVDGVFAAKAALRFVATDGHRLSFVDRPADGLSVASSFIIPRKGIHELRKLLDSEEGVTKVEIAEGFFTAATDDVTIGIRLVDGQFPDYRQVIPSETKTTLEAARGEFLAAVKRVSLVTTDRSRSIRFGIVGNTLNVSSSSPEHGEASESFPVSKTGDDVSVGFSARYIVDLLGAMERSETITARFNGELGPGMFTGNGDEHYTCIVMPMRFE